MFCGPAAPRVGQSIALRLTGAPTLAPIAFAFGSRQDRWGGAALPFPLGPLGFTGCVLHVATDVLVPTSTDAADRVSLPVSVPPETSLVGARLYVQSLHPDASANPAGATLSQALRFVIGR